MRPVAEPSLGQRVGWYMFLLVEVIGSPQYLCSVQYTQRRHDVLSVGGTNFCTALFMHWFSEDMVLQFQECERSTHWFWTF